MMTIKDNFCSDAFAFEYVKPDSVEHVNQLKRQPEYIVGANGYFTVKSRKTQDIVYCHSCNEEEMHKNAKIFTQALYFVKPTKCRHFETTIGLYLHARYANERIFDRLPLKCEHQELYQYLDDTYGVILFKDQLVEICNIFIKDMKVADKIFHLMNHSRHEYMAIISNKFYKETSLETFLRCRVLNDYITTRDTYYSIRMFEANENFQTEDIVTTDSKQPFQDGENCSVKELVRRLEVGMKANEFATNQTNWLAEYIFKASGILDQNYLSAWGTCGNGYSAMFRVERCRASKVFSTKAFENLKHLGIFNRHGEFTLRAGAFYWNPCKIMFYIHVEWSKNLKVNLLTRNRLINLDKNTHQRSHMMACSETSMYVYCDLIEDFEYSKTISILKEAHAIISGAAVKKISEIVL